MNKLLYLSLLLSIAMFSITGCEDKSKVVTEIINTKSVRIQEIKNESYSDTISYSGYVSAKDVKNFSFELSGKISEVLITKGQKVTSGQALAKLDTTNVQMSMDSSNENIILANNSIKQIENAVNKINIGIEAENINLNKIDAGIRAEEMNLKNIGTSIEAEVLNLKKIEDTYNSNIDKVLISYNTQKDSYERIKTLYESDVVSQQDFDNAKSSFDTVSKELESVKLNKENDILLQNKKIETMNNGLEMEKINAINLESDRELQKTNIKNMENELEATNLKLEAANINLKQADISLEQSTKQLNDSILFSSIDGYVLDITVKAGEITGAGTPVVIVKTQDQVINVGISVDDYNKIETGMTISIEREGEVFTGIVSTVSLYPDEASRTYNIEIIPDKKDLLMGSLVNVKIPIGQKEGYFIPISSVLNIEGVNYIYIVEKASDDGIYEVHRKEVVLGKVYGEKVLVENISSAINIIYEGIKNIKENDKVTIVQ